MAFPIYRPGDVEPPKWAFPEIFLGRVPQLEKAKVDIGPEPEVVPPPTIIRPRARRVTYDPSAEIKVTAQALGAPAPAPGPCLSEGGQLVNSGILQTVDIQTTVGVTDRLIGPAVVVQIAFLCFNAALSTTLRAILKVSDDNSTSGGEDTSGERLSGTSGTRDFHPSNTWENLYPYLTINRSSFFLKFICVSSALLGTLNWEFVVCLKRL